MNIEFTKLNHEKMTITGVAYMCTVDGLPVTDHSGDTISIATLEKAAHEYINHSRAGKEAHTGTQVMHLLNSFVFSKEMQDSLGINLGYEGWVVTMKIDSPEVWEKVKHGEYPMLSIGGCHSI